MNYVFYKPNGEITKTLSCSLSDLEHNLDPACDYLEDRASFDDYVDVDARKIKPKGLRPSETHDFNYTTKQWVANQDKAWADVKSRRDQLLRSSDWVVLRDLEAGKPAPVAWRTYRQALRDITLQADPWAIVWPVAP